jgi:hypothetical protein
LHDAFAIQLLYSNAGTQEPFVTRWWALAFTLAAFMKTLGLKPTPL